MKAITTKDAETVLAITVYASIWISTLTVSPIVAELRYSYLFTLVLFWVVFSFLNVLGWHKESISLRLNPNKIKQIINGVFLAFWPLAILSVVLIPPVHTEASFMDWSQIPTLNYVRLAGVVLLTFVYPGYSIINIFSRDEKWTTIGKMVISIHLSIVLSSFVTIFTLNFMGSVAPSISFLLLLNGIMLVCSSLYFVRNWLKVRFSTQINESKQIRIHVGDLFGYSLLFGVLLLTLLSIYAIWFPNNFLTGWDHWRYYSSMLRIIDNFRIEGDAQYFVLLMLGALYISSTGLPSLNAYMTIFWLPVLTILSFYLLCSCVLNRRLSTIASFVFSFFSGLGSLFVIYLNTFEGVHIKDAITQISYKASDIIVGNHLYSFSPYALNLALSFSFMIIYVAHNCFVRRYLGPLLISVFFAASFWINAVANIILTFVIFIMLIVYRRYLPRPNELAVSVLLGSLLSLSLFLAAQRLSTLPYLLGGGLLVWSPVAIVAIAMLSLLIPYVARCMRFTRPKFPYTQHLISISWILALYVLLLSIIIWWVNRDAIIFSGVAHPLYWYMYPLKLGVPLFLATFSIFYLRSEQYSKALRLGLILTFVPFTLGRAYSYLLWLGIYELPYHENRMASLTLMGLAILSSVGFSELLKNIHLPSGSINIRSGRTWVSLLLIVLLVPAGTMSTFMTVYGEGTTMLGLPAEPYRLNADDWELIDYIVNNTPYNISILTDRPYQSFVLHFAGRTTVDLGSYINPPDADGFKTSNPILFLSALENNLYVDMGLSPRYYVFNKQPYEPMPRSFLRDQLSKYLPILLENERSILFYIPPLAPPTDPSNTIVVQPDAVVNQTSYVWTVYSLALARVKYSVRLSSDVNLFSTRGTNVILTHDPDPSSQEAKRFFEWVSEGGHLIVLNSVNGQNQGFFAQKLAIHTLQNITESSITGIKGPNDHLIVPQLKVPHFISEDDAVREIAYYTNNDHPVVPYAFRAKIGRGQVTFVEIFPYYEALQKYSSSSIGRQLFMGLSKLLTVLDIPFERNLRIAKEEGKALIYDSATFWGVSLESESFSIPEMNALVESFRVDLSGVNSLSIDPPSEIRILNGTTLLSLQVAGKYKVKFTSPEAKLIPLQLGAYSSFLLERANFSIELDDHAEMRLSCKMGEQIYNITAQGGIVQFFYEPPAEYIADDKQTSFWTVRETGTGKYALKIYDDTAEKVHGLDSLKLEVTDGTAQRLSIFHEFKSPQNWGNRRYVMFYWYGTNSQDSWSLSIWAPDYRNQMYYEFTDNFVGWREFIIRIEDFSKIGAPDMKAVRALEFRVFPEKVYTNRLDAFRAPLPNELTVYVRDAKVYAHEATFEKIYIPYTEAIYVPRLPMTVNGSIGFKIKGSDNSRILISNLNITGKYKTLSQQFTTLDEWNIPWGKVAQTPYFTFLNIGTSLAIGYVLGKSGIRILRREGRAG